MKQITKTALLLWCCLMWSTEAAKAQDKPKYTLSGYVKDASTGEYSIGATIYLKELQKGGNTNV